MLESTVRPDGTKVRELRKSKRLTQEQLADKVGCSKRTIENVEAGKNVTETILEQIASELGEAIGCIRFSSDSAIGACDNKEAEESGSPDRIDSCTTESMGVDDPLGATPHTTEGGVAVVTNRASIEIVINRDFDSYTSEEQQQLLDAIKTFLEADGDIRVTRKRPGSVVLTLDLSGAQAEKLQWAVKAGLFETFKLADAKILDERAANVQSPNREGLTASKQLICDKCGKSLESTQPDGWSHYVITTFKVPHRSEDEESSDMEEVKSLLESLASAEEDVEDYSVRFYVCAACSVSLCRDPLQKQSSAGATINNKPD